MKQQIPEPTEPGKEHPMMIRLRTARLIAGAAMLVVERTESRDSESKEYNK